MISSLSKWSEEFVERYSNQPYFPSDTFQEVCFYFLFPSSPKGHHFLLGVFEYSFVSSGFVVMLIPDRRSNSRFYCDVVRYSRQAGARHIAQVLEWSFRLGRICFLCVAIAHKYQTGSAQNSKRFAINNLLITFHNAEETITRQLLGSSNLLAFKK